MTTTKIQALEEEEVTLADFLKSVKVASYDEEKALVPMLAEGLI